MSDATPTLPRFWWLKRIAAAYGIVALLLAALTGAWSWRSSVALRSLQEEWRAEGAPATVDEINAMGPPFDARARDDGDRFRAAADALSKSPFPENDRRLRDRHENVDRRAPIAQRDIDLARRAAQFHAKPLATIESLLDEHADGQPIDFGTRFRTPMISVLLPHLNGLRSAGDSLNELARLRHAEGDHAAALATVQRLLTLTREELTARLRLTPDELDSLLRLVGSQLDVSLRVLMAD